MLLTRQMKKMLIIVGTILGLIFGWFGVKTGIIMFMMSHYTPPPTTISASPAKTTTWQSYLSSIGTLTAVNGVDISSEVAGTVQAIRFQSGQFVKTGDVLVVLDNDIENAQLQNDKSQLQLAQINFNRDQTLVKKNVVSRAAFDITSAQLAAAQASVNGSLARIKQKILTAPFSGKIGVKQINIGQYISPGTMIVTLQALNPLYVMFNLPEQYLPQLHAGQKIQILPNITNAKAVTGEITAINSKIDPATRNMLVQATIPNNDSALYPGMYVNVTIWLEKKANVVIVPETAITYSLHGDSIFVVKTGKDKHGKENLIVNREYIKTGERRGDDIAILSGLKAGEQVVTSGQLKLQNGTQVVIDNNSGL